MIKIANSPVVVTLLSQRFDKASRVACICRRHAIADSFPQILATLAAAAGTEEIVVELVVAGRIRAVKYCSFMSVSIANRTDQKEQETYVMYPSDQ